FTSFPRLTIPRTFDPVRSYTKPFGALRRVGSDMNEVTADSGSRRADFDDTFRRCYGPMVRSLSVSCGGGEGAADRVQDAFTRASTRWARVRPLDDPGGWTRHVAVNRIRDHFRRAERGSRAVVQLAQREPTHAPPPAEPSELGALLATLPDQQR